MGLQRQQRMLSRKLKLSNILHLVKGKRVLMRVDFNVPIKEGVLKDVTRIKSAIPSIDAVFKAGAQSVILMSHLGRPDGQKSDKDSLKAILPTVEKLAKRPVTFLPDCVGPEVEKACANPKQGSVILLENLRFHVEEEGSGKKDGKKIEAAPEAVKKFRQSLTKLGDIYINDAFGTAHRAHSSMVGVELKTRAAGFLLAKELESFAKVMEKPDRPLLVIMGGAKVKDKIQIITKMLDLVDEMIIGGGMTFTFQKVHQNMGIGDSIFDVDGAKIVADIMKKAEEKGVKMHFPIDFRCGDKFDKDANVKICKASAGIPAGWRGLDNGPETEAVYAEVIKRARTVLWNGPQGVSEFPAFRESSLRMLENLMEITENGASTIAGGGETVSLIQSVRGAAEKLSHVSTGGGASLELLEGRELPGIAALSDSQSCLAHTHSHSHY
eukprot:TRINITY_DN15326_c0_g1_i1.p1 TRINITY_DN15326_c0_g1~~TRINITY_DN15326_c0_g1_i1.p1  ORF type:complete len:452 (-),score=114.84 TRINITY_DN15326_c0_g1_i1:84-1400(-)